jgi:ABC-type polysaccharide/polyol phosphate export permease
MRDRSPRAILSDIWRSRELLFQLTRRDVAIRYKQALMGFAWAVLTPAFAVLAGLVIRLAFAAQANQELAPGALGGVAVKALGWTFFSGAIGFATASLLANVALITKIYFPREVLPLSAVAAQGFDSALGALVLTPVLPFLGATLSPALLWVPLLLLLLVGFTAAAALFLSSANLFYRDVKYLVQVALTFGVLVTPVFFEPGMVGDRLGRLLMLNPIAPILEGLRITIIEGVSLHHPGGPGTVWHPAWLLYSLLWAGPGLLLAARGFRRSAARFAEFA